MARWCMACSPNSPADQAGIRPGDIITGVGSHLVSNPSDAVKAVRGALKQDQTVALRILRDGQDAFVAIFAGHRWWIAGARR